MSLTEELKKRPLILLIVLLAAHWIVVSLNRAPEPGGRRLIQVWILAVFSPVHTATTKTTSVISTTWNDYFSRRDARRENEVLRTRVAQLETDLVKAGDLQQRALILERQLNLKQTQPFANVAAQVIGRDADHWLNTVMIDQGTLSGVSEGQPVITSEGLVGRVIQAAPNAARVLLLTDERHGTGAVIGQLADSRLLGVVRGKNSSLCEMKIVSGEAKVQVGEVVLTSGQDGIYPRGLIIGRVARVETGAGGNPLAIEIAPAAPLAKLDLVSVLQITKEQIRAALDEMDRLEKERLEKERLEKEKERQLRNAAPKK